MKFEVYGTPKKDEKIVRFKLRVDLAGDLCLCAVDEGGSEISTILWIKSEKGKLELSDFIEEGLGLDLNENGQIRIDY